MKLAPEPVDGLPPGADHVKVNGEVPPVAEALHVTGLPAVALPQVTVTTIAWPPTLTVASANFLAPLLSVAVALTVLLPLVEYVVVKLAPVPVAGVPPGADQENVKGVVPPVAEALQVTGLPVVAAPQVTVTTIACPVTTTLAVCDFLALLPSVAVALTTNVPLVA